MPQGFEDMSIFYLIVAFGVASGGLAILVVVAFDALRKRRGDRNAGAVIPKTILGGLGLGGLVGPGSLIARAGQDKPARMTLNTAVMTPTAGLRWISLGGAAIILIVMWNPLMLAHYGDELTLHLLVTGVLVYNVMFISGYEARYDAEGITAPNWLFQDRHYTWEEFISIKDDGHYLYRLRFESGRMAMQKHLVGMPTFITFVAEVREMNKRL